MILHPRRLAQKTTYFDVDNRVRVSILLLVLFEADSLSRLLWFFAQMTTPGPAAWKMDKMVPLLASHVIETDHTHCGDRCFQGFLTVPVYASDTVPDLKARIVSMLPDYWVAKLMYRGLPLAHCEHSEAPVWPFLPDMSDRVPRFSVLTRKLNKFSS